MINYNCGPDQQTPKKIYKIAIVEVSRDAHVAKIGHALKYFGAHKCLKAADICLPTKLSFSSFSFWPLLMILFDFTSSRSVRSVI